MYNYFFIICILAIIFSCVVIYYFLISQWYSVMVTGVTHVNWPIREAARNLISLISSTSMVVMKLIQRLCSIIVDTSFVSICVYVYVYVCVFMCVCMCMCVCMYVCIDVFM